MRRTKQIEGQQICDNLLSDGKVLEIISSFRRLVESSYGPNGRLKFLRTYAGGHVTVTSSSIQIVNHLIGTSHPVLRMIMMAIKGHLDVFSDGGLMMAILITRLIESSLKLDVPRAVIVEVISDAQNILTNYLNSGSCQWKIKIDVGDMKTILCLVKTVLGTKPACCLSERNKDFLCAILLKAFLQSVPTKQESNGKHSMNPIEFITCQGCPVMDTTIINGVLLEAPELSTYTHKATVRDLKVALYNISLAGDTDEWTEGLTSVAMDGLKRDDLNRGVLEIMKGVASWLVVEGVGLLACQKVIHPALKTFLKEKDIYVIDRLSVLHIGSVQRLSGAKILSTFTKDIHKRWFGHIGSIEHMVIGSKSYLRLLPAAMSMLDSESSVLSEPLAGDSMASSRMPSKSPSLGLPKLPQPSTLLSSQPSLSSGPHDPSTSQHPAQPLTSTSSFIPQYIRESPQQPLSSCPVTTMVLCAPNETSLNELKLVCQSVISVLRGVLSSPYVVPGGGCLETHLAWYLQSVARTCGVSSLDRMGCSRAQYVIVMDSIACCLETVARCLDHDCGDHMTDSTNHHHWILGPGELISNSDIRSCICGLVSRDDCKDWCILGDDGCWPKKPLFKKQVDGDGRTFKENILDLYLGRVTSLQAAFETASVILRVKHFVTN